MTAHVIVFSFILVLFLSIQRMRLKGSWSTSRQALLNIPIMLSLLPLAYPGITVIADFFFEGFTDNLIWFSIFYLPLLGVSFYYLYRNLSEKKGSVQDNVWSILMGGILIVGYVCAIISSHHESGPTPVVTDSGYLMFYFIFIHFTLLLSFVNQVYSLIRCQRNKILTWGKFALSIFFLVIYVAIAAGSELAKSPATAGNTKFWPSQVPAGCPLAQSDKYFALGFTGQFAVYSNADTWYPSWGADDRLYSPFTDGTVTGPDDSGEEKTVKSFSGGATAVVGHAIITGSDPMNLSISEPGLITGNPAPYQGRYPCASLYKDGVWYIGTYALNSASYGLNWPICGLFAGFHISKDNGKTWTPSPLSCEPGKALFPEPATLNGPVKFGVPHVVDFGKNMENSPDGKMYMVAHGSLQKDQEDRKANVSWTTGDQIYLCRVTPSPETINDAKHYEYFGGNDRKGKPVWTKDLEQAKPILDWNNTCGGVTITYNKPLKKYLMCVTNGGNTVSMYDSYLLEADKITGPWKMVTYMKNFGTQGYFLNIPSKFISADGRSFWLCYSANWENQMGKKYASIPEGGSYSMTLQQVRLLTKKETAKMPAMPVVE